MLSCCSSTVLIDTVDVSVTEVFDLLRDLNRLKYIMLLKFPIFLSGNYYYSPIVFLHISYSGINISYLKYVTKGPFQYYDVVMDTRNILLWV